MSGASVVSTVAALPAAPLSLPPLLPVPFLLPSFPVDSMDGPNNNGGGAVENGTGNAGNGTVKYRKPYTLSKARENWTEQEHSKFLTAVSLYERDWKRVSAFIQTKSLSQVRSHAQKFLAK